MKKVMMTAFAVVLAAGVASAASINWNIAGNSVGVRPDGSDWTSGNQTPAATPIYYALILAGDLELATAAVMGDGFAVNTSGGGESGVFLGWGVTTANRGASASPTNPNIAVSTKVGTTAQDYIAFAFGQDDTGSWYYWASGILTDKIGYTTSPDDGTAATFGPSTFNANNGGTGWVLIPEPTAMALLALGAAAVGLRRRFRK